MIAPTQDWSESTLRRVGYVPVGVAMVAFGTSVVVALELEDPGFAVEQVMIGVPFAVVLVGLLRTVPRNRTVWVLAWGACFGSLGAATTVLTEARLGFPVPDIGKLAGSPASLDLITSLSVNIGAWSWLLGVFLLSVHLFLLFPSGIPSSSRWGVLLRVSTVTLVVAAGTTALALAPWVETPYADMIGRGVGWHWGQAAFMASAPMLIVTLFAVVNLIQRYRRSSGDERLQFRWVAWALALSGLVLLSFWPLSEFEFYSYLSAASLAAIPLSIGVAITKYRLYDIDVVISRTLVYGTLALFIGAVYVGIAVLPWLIIGSEAENNTWLGILATVVVAVSFQPLRRRLQRVANRVVYGRRASPYEVLSSFSQSIAAVDPVVFAQMARSLAEGTTADAASVWVGAGESAHAIARWPEESATPGASSETALVIHDGEQLGEVRLAIPAGQPFPETDRRLLDQVAAGLGLALRNLQLTDVLSNQVEQLRESRRRVVALQDQTRRLLERDLHDGAQQRLVALKIKIGLASTMARTSGAEDVDRILSDVKDETDQTIDSLRDLARGIYPPLLEAEGLGAALSAQLRRSAVPATVQAAGIDRYSEGVEATIYFCVLEAVQNAIRHARAQSVAVTVQEEDEALVYEVRDDGIGFDAETSDHGGQGLINMADRLDAMEGTLSIDSQAGRGTVVRGSVPFKTAVPA